MGIKHWVWKWGVFISLQGWSLALIRIGTTNYHRPMNKCKDGEWRTCTVLHWRHKLNFLTTPRQFMRRCQQPDCINWVNCTCRGGWVVSLLLNRLCLYSLQVIHTLRLFFYNAQSQEDKEITAHLIYRRKLNASLFLDQDFTVVHCSAAYYLHGA